MNDVVAAELAARHGLGQPPELPSRAAPTLRAAYPDFTFSPPRPAPTSGSATVVLCSVGATVLDVHEVERGDAFGYRHRTAPKAGHILVVSGGTAHGIGLEAPDRRREPQGASRHPRPEGAWTRPASCARRSRSTASSGSSPSRRTCRRRCSSCPHGARVPEIGDQVEVRVRYTATDFDRVVVT